jgi:transcriptional regulator with XRE-family HTH domain
MTFGKAIRTARVRAGLTQATVAADCHISTQYLCDLEQDRRGPHDDDLILILAARLYLPYGYLVFLAGRIPWGMWEGLKAWPVDAGMADAAWEAFARVMRGEDRP